MTMFTRRTLVKGGTAAVAAGQVMTSDGDVESTIRSRINGISD